MTKEQNCLFFQSADISRNFKNSILNLTGLSCFFSTCDSDFNSCFDIKDQGLDSLTHYINQSLKNLQSFRLSVTGYFLNKHLLSYDVNRDQNRHAPITGEGLRVLFANLNKNPQPLTKLDLTLDL